MKNPDTETVARFTAFLDLGFEFHAERNATGWTVATRIPDPAFSGYVAEFVELGLRVVKMQESLLK